MVSRGALDSFATMNTHTLRNRFPLIAAVALAALTVIGFTRTYYLRFLTDLPPMMALVHVHGILCTAWLVLHFGQARLVAARHVKLHTRMGIFTALIGVAIVVTGAMLSIDTALLGRAPPGRDPLQFLSVSLGSTVMFGLFLTAALVLRRRSEWHKRLMLLTTMVFLLPAIGRLDRYVVEYGIPRGVLPFIVTAAFLVWACMNDLRKRGHVHPAYSVGGSVLLAAIPFRIWLGTNDFWMPFARWVTQ